MSLFLSKFIRIQTSFFAIIQQSFIVFVNLCVLPWLLPVVQFVEKATFPNPFGSRQSLYLQKKEQRLIGFYALRHLSKVLEGGCPQSSCNSKFYTQNNR